MERAADTVYCDVHGGLHRESTNPDDTPHHRKEGREIFLEYADDGSVQEAEPECGPPNWRKVWVGARVTTPRES